MHKLDNNSNMTELTIRGIIIGTFLTIIFTASNVYLGLKVGLTFSSAIPSAVLSMAALRFFSSTSILENNMVQTQASAAGTLASIIFVLPGLLMINYWSGFPFWQTMLICACGGILGVIFSIPLRYAMVVKSTLPYPEGLAAAEILKAGCETDGEENSQSVRDIAFGSSIAAVIALFTSGFKLLSGSSAIWLSAGKAIFQIPFGFSTALLSAGYLVGLSSGFAFLVGLIVNWGIIIPILSIITPHPVGFSIADIGMSLWSQKVRFIGAGFIAISAIWSLIAMAKPVWDGVKNAMRLLKTDSKQVSIERTEQDLSPLTMILITIVVFCIMLPLFYTFINDMGLSTGITWLLVIVSVGLAFLIGFLVAAASGYMAGLVGSSSSPISGIGIIAIIIVSITLLVISNTSSLSAFPGIEKPFIALAIFTTSAVLAIACISNDNLQDLKTGYILKATPWRQEFALIIGCIVGALVISPVLQLLYNAYGFTGALPREGMDPTHVLAAPQATLMTTISKSILQRDMEWKMILIGVMLGIVFIFIDKFLERKKTFLRVPPMAVSMSIYLPPSVVAPIFFGSLLSWIVKRSIAKKAEIKNVDYESLKDSTENRGILIASGIIVGESLVGVLIAIIIVISLSMGGGDSPLSLAAPFAKFFGSSFKLIVDLLSASVFIGLCWFFIKRVTNRI